MNFFKSRLFILLSAVFLLITVGFGIFLLTAPKVLVNTNQIKLPEVTRETFEKATFLSKLDFGPTTSLSSTKMLDVGIFLYSTKDGLKINKNLIANSIELRDKIIHSTVKVGDRYILNFGLESYWLKNDKLEKIDKAFSITSTPVKIGDKIQNSFIYLVKKDTEIVVATSISESFVDNVQVLGKLPLTGYNFAQLVPTQGTVYLVLYFDETKKGDIQIVALPTAKDPQLTNHYLIKNALDIKFEKDVIYYTTYLSTPTDLTTYDLKTIDLKNKSETSLNANFVYIAAQEKVLGSFAPARCTTENQALYCIVKKNKVGADDFTSADVIVKYSFENKDVKVLYDNFKYSASELFAKNNKIYLISQQEKQFYEIK